MTPTNQGRHYVFDRQNENHSVKYQKAWQNFFFFSSLIAYDMNEACSIVPFPIVKHHIFISITMRIHFMWCLQLNENLFPLDDILIEIPEQTTSQLLMFWKCTYSEMILEGFLLLQLNPSHENSLGTHGSPCQFLVTMYRSLISMIASTIVINWEKKKNSQMIIQKESRREKIK